MAAGEAYRGEVRACPSAAALLRWTASSPSAQAGVWKMSRTPLVCSQAERALGCPVKMQTGVSDVRSSADSTATRVAS
eukprot:scaffold23186_cov112-Isochrysis_galbana.AAC.11